MRDDPSTLDGGWPRRVRAGRRRAAARRAPEPARLGRALGCGSCASGGPYAIETTCPDGAAPVLSTAIPLAMLAAGGFAVFGWRLGRGVPVLAVLAWPALFLSLGWNFLDYGAISPRDGGGVEGGWLFCGVVFLLMGAPALLGLPRIVRGIDERRALVLGWTALAAGLGGLGGWLLVEALA